MPAVVQAGTDYPIPTPPLLHHPSIPATPFSSTVSRSRLSPWFNLWYECLVCCLLWAFSSRFFQVVLFWSWSSRVKNFNLAIFCDTISLISVSQTLHDGTSYLALPVQSTFSYNDHNYFKVTAMSVLVETFSCKLIAFILICVMFIFANQVSLSFLFFFFLSFLYIHPCSREIIDLLPYLTRSLMRSHTHAHTYAQTHACMCTHMHKQTQAMKQQQTPWGQVHGEQTLLFW